MKYVITGATSFLGVHLCDYLLDEGQEVFAICRQGSPKTSKLQQHKNLHIIYADMTEYRQLKNQINQADVFVNFAWNATIHEGRDQKESQWQNVEHSLDALIAARKMGCNLFVEAGSQAEYGSTQECQTEQSECRPFSEYGKSKLAIKDMAFAYAKLTGMKYIHLRIFSTYGEGDKPWTLVTSAIEKMKKNEEIDLTPCTQNWNFVYVKDAVKQIVLLCDFAFRRDDFTQEIYHVASEDTRPLKDFVMEMKRQAGSDSRLNFGAVTPAHFVSLQPDMTKTKSAIGFISDYKFAEGIKNVINSI